MPASHHLAYEKIANVYDTFLTVSGFKRGVENFLSRLEFELPPKARILDAGCGTGLLTRCLAPRFPSAEICAFDIDENMLSEMERLIARERFRPNVILTKGDLRNPSRLTVTKTGQPIFVPRDYFDAVCVSGALEHAPLGESVRRLAKLLKPGGIFFNLGIRRNPAGAVLAMVYRFRPYAVAEMRHALSDAGLEQIRVLRLGIGDFPANLSRIAFIARKKY